MSSDTLKSEGFFKEVVVSSAHAVLVCSLDGDLEYCNDVVRERTGHDRGELRDASLSEVCRGPDRDLLAEAKTRAIDATAGESVRVDGQLVSADGEPEPVTFAVEPSEYDGNQYLVLRTVEHPESNASSESGSEETGGRGLGGPASRFETALDAATSIADAESLEAASGVYLDWATEFFDAEPGCVRVYDEDENRFERVAETGAARRLRENRPVFNLDETHAGRAFRRGEPVVEDFDTETADESRWSLHVPLGDRGVLSVFPSAEYPLAGDRVAVVAAVGSVFVSELVGADSGATGGRPFETVRASLDTLREVESVSEAVGIAGQRLFEAEDATEMKRALTAVLQSKGPFDIVQVVKTDTADDRTVVDGSDTERSALAPELAVPAVRAALRDVADSRHGVETVRTGGTAGTDGEAAVTVASIRPGKHKRSVLVASRDADLGLDAAVEDRLETLGYLAGFALQTIRDQELLLGEQRIELEFEVTGESCLAVPISSELECYCEVEHATLTGDGDHLLFVRADHPDPQAVIEAADSVDSVTECRVVDSDDTGCVLEVTKTESGAQAMMNVGATILGASAKDGVGTLVIELPPSVNPGDVVDEYVSRTDSAHLVAQRTVDEPVEVPTPSGDVFESELTDKQRSAVTTAYHAGYFDWPRKSTAEDIASALSVSSPTFQQHLRRALHKILDYHV